MNDEQFAFFKRLVDTVGPSGYEQAAQRVWREQVQSVADEVRVDSLGNAVASLNSSGHPRVMLDAHIDQIGFAVRYIDENGYLFFAPIGGFDPSTLAGNRVVIQGKHGPVPGVIGRKPIHLIDPDERKKMPELKNMWIDVGAGSKDEAESLLSIGDGGGRHAGVQRLHGNIVTGAGLDDRVASYMLVEIMRNLAAARPTAAVFAASSVQEEVGLRGAQVSAFDVNADIGIALEVTWTTDHPQSSKSELGDVEVGAGPVIFRGTNTNPRVFERLVEAARAENVDFQVDVYARGSPTDANVMQTSRGGMAAGIVSVPTRYLHTASEVLSTDDVDRGIKVITRFIQDLPQNVDLTP